MYAHVASSCTSVWLTDQVAYYTSDGDLTHSFESVDHDSTGWSTEQTRPFALYICVTVPAVHLVHDMTRLLHLRLKGTPGSDLHRLCIMVQI